MLKALLCKRIFFENISPFEELHYYLGKLLFGHEFPFFNYKFPLVSYKISLYSSGVRISSFALSYGTLGLERLSIPNQR